MTIILLHDQPPGRLTTMMPRMSKRRLSSEPTSPSGAMSRVLVASLALASLVDAQKVSHPWRCCGIRHEPLEIKAMDVLEFSVEGEADVWEFNDKSAFDACDFSRSRQVSIDASNKAVAAASSSETTRYFSSKKGMLGNACNVDEWPLKLQVNVKGDAPVTGQNVVTPAAPKKKKRRRKKKTRQRIKYEVKKKQACDGVGKPNRRGRKASKCKATCNKMKSAAKYCYAYQYDRKKPAAKKCTIFTSLAATKFKEGPATSICYIKQGGRAQAS